MYAYICTRMYVYMCVRMYMYDALLGTIMTDSHACSCQRLETLSQPRMRELGREAAMTMESTDVPLIARAQASMGGREHYGQVRVYVYYCRRLCTFFTRGRCLWYVCVCVDFWRKVPARLAAFWH